MKLWDEEYTLLSPKDLEREHENRKRRKKPGERKEVPEISILGKQREWQNG